MVTIDWTRVAEPQPDQYDSQVVLEFATTRTSPLRTRRAAAGASTICDGAVAVRHIYQPCPGFPDYSDAPADHPNIALAAEYLRLWPAAFTQFQLLMDTFHPLVDMQVTWDSDFASNHLVLGSTCGSDEAVFGAMHATVYCPIGLAEAFVHEMAHQKLRALGISLEKTNGLITNPPEEQFVSPLRKDCLRPMSAVFHAEYSYTYVTHLDTVLIEQEQDDAMALALCRQLAINLARIEEGADVLARHVKVDQNGRAFLEGFFNWNSRLIRTANDLLRAVQIQ